MPKPNVCMQVDGSSGDEHLEYQIARVFNEVFELFKKKQHDYGPHNIGLLQDRGVLTRVTDKFMRLHTLYNPDGKCRTLPVNESVDDTWLDICDYAAIALLCRRGHWPKSTITEVCNPDTHNPEVGEFAKSCERYDVHVSESETMISLVEEMILNNEFLPDYMKGWRRYRIEYPDPETGYSNVEGLVYLPPERDADDLERMLDSFINTAYFNPDGN